MNENTYLAESVYWEIAGLFEKYPGALGLFEAFASAVFSRYPEAELRVQKTQAGFFSGCGFAWASPMTRWRRKYPAGGIIITLALPMQLDSPRVEASTQPYPGRWTHHLVLTSADELDEEFLSWLDSAHDFARLRKELPRGAQKQKGDA